jgi:hypothetical protein
MTLFWRALFALALGGLTLTLSSCSSCARKNSLNSSSGGAVSHDPSASQTASRATQPEPVGQSSGYAHVTFRPNVRVMEEEEGRGAIIGISTYENALLFDPSNATARALRTGDVLMIKNLIARKVLAAEETPDGVIVLTEKAALTDLIQDGQIHIEMPVRYGPLQATVPRRSVLEVEQSLGVAAGNLHAVRVADRDLIEPFFGLDHVLERVVN